MIGKGFNQIKSHSGLRKKYGYYSIHAETDAVIDARCRGDTIVIARIGRNGVVGNSRPCPKCMEYLKDNGIKKVYYTNDLGELEMERIK